MKDKQKQAKSTINCRGKILTIDSPIVMGIVNATPDSFYSGSRAEKDNVLRIVEKYINEGAKIIDLGAFSSRPNGETISYEEETKRLIPILEEIRKSFPDILISIDSFRSEVVKKAIPIGIDFINDISAGILDTELPILAGKHHLPYIAMHMRGTPKTMQENCEYTNLILDVNSYFSQRCLALKEAGVKDIILDPGFGFSKTLNQNYEILGNLHEFLIHDCIVLAGLSRKSMIYKLLGTGPENALNGTSALHMTALDEGAKILRVHDVKEAQETITLFNKIIDIKKGAEAPCN